MLSGALAVAALLVVCATAASRWLLKRRASDLDVFLAFGPVALLGLLELLPDPQQYYDHPAVLALTVVQPVLFCRLLRHIGRSPRAPALIAAAGGLWSVAILLRDPHAYDPDAPLAWDLVAAAVAAYVVPNLWVGVLFARAAVRSAGVTKVRLAWAALSAFLFIAAMLAYSIPSGSPASAASDAIYIALAVAFLLGFAPPRWVQRSWRATAYVQFDRALGGIPSDARPEEADRAILDATRGVLDADALRFAPARSAGAGEISAATGASGDHAFLVATFNGPRMFPDDDRLTVEALAGHCWQQLEPRERLQREEAARKAAEEQAAFKASFLRHFGHEVANPLSPIRLKAGLLERGATDEQRPHFDVIRRNIQRIEEIIEDVSNVAKAIDPRAPRQLTEVDVGGLLRDAAATYADTAAKAGCRLRVECPAGVRVVADRPRLAQVVDNLYSNAIKYSPGGGEVEVRASEADGGVRVEVADGGLGFDEAQGALLFRTYSRVHKEVAPAIPGSGLGLYLVQEVAHAHGGWAKAASAGPGRGSTFTVWLPAQPAATPAMAAFRQ